ncbi:hypothetical protein CPB84DRAFT_1474135 [Gymnopilus junonius]|uniref:Uncharacterized protein n=1 Tax=Gymnopilus junonius TaxID=109634 RepID=A0A9P5TKC7_GYMJU|nr:hypothetical protein CPB84DRAFT_1474135 [Gymnopilus junonius]
MGVVVQLPLGMGAEALPSAIGLGNTSLGEGDEHVPESTQAISSSDPSNLKTNRKRRRKIQRVCWPAQYGVQLGLLRYLRYFQNTAARESCRSIKACSPPSLTLSSSERCISIAMRITPPTFSPTSSCCS